MIFFSFLLLALFGRVAAQRWEPVIVDLEKNPPKPGEMVTRLIKVDYSFETESVVYDDIENKINAPSIHLAGNFSFETLHYDMEGNVLARFKMTECRLGPCDVEIPSVFLSFVQGGNNINAVYIDSKNGTISPKWNFLFAIVNTIYTPALNGEGDDQTVDTVYGRCRVQFGRPENKKFRRIIDGCELGKKEDNYTRIEYADYAHFNQDVWYTQNTKVDADIVIIDAVEMLHVRSPFDGRWGFQLESRTHVEITNRSQYYVEDICVSSITANDCATKELGLTKVGDKFYEEVLIGEKKSEDSKLLSLLKNYREHLFDMGESHKCTEHASLYAEVFSAARKASEAEWNAAIHAPENEPLLQTIANLFGSLGTSESLQIAKNVLFPQGNEFVDDFLFGVANAAGNDEKWHKQLMYWLSETKEDEELYWKVANTLATVFKRRCDKTTSSINACQKGKDRIIMKFIDDLTDCKTDECRLNSMNVLQNIPLPKPYQIARGYLCGRHPPSLQTAALRLISSAPSHQYDSQLVQLLVRLFRDTCPQETNSVDGQLAVDILSRCVPDLQNAATLLLRGETENPVDHERWQYFYSIIKASGEKDELKEEFWKRMRQFKVFRPNYAQRSLVANSFAHWQSLAEIGGFDIQEEAKSHFDDLIFKAFDFKLSAKRGKKTHPLFGLSIWSEGMESYLKNSEEIVEPSASGRLSLFGHSLPILNIFKGQGDLMSKVWNADGQTIKAFEGNVVLRSAEVSLPLLSGASVDFFSRGAASISLFASCEISIFSRESIADIASNISLALTSEAVLVHSGEVQRRVGSQWSAVTSIGTNTEVAFQQHPVHVCATLNRQPIRIRLDTWQSEGERRQKRKTLEGETLRQHEAATKQCNLHASAHHQEN